MKVGVVGSRTFTERAYLYKTLDAINTADSIGTVVSGGAIGADTMAREWAYGQAAYIEHLPDRERYGWPRAAFERNSLIVADSDILLAFFGPDEPPIKGDRHFGSGTMDTVTKAIAKRIPVHLYFQGER